MGFLNRVFERRASLENPKLSLTDPDAWDEAGLLHDRTESGVRVTPRKALGHPPLWRGLNLLANSVSKLPLSVFKRVGETGRERAKDHAAFGLLKRKPNRSMRAVVFKRTLTFHAVFLGNGYAAIFRGADNRPESLVPLSPYETFPIQVGGQLWYRTVIKGEQRKLPAEDVLHVHGLGFDGLKGYSIVEVLAEAIGGDIAPAEYAHRFFGEGANAAGILMIPGHLKGDAIKNAIKDFEQIATGVKRQHKVGLLQDGVKWQPMTINGEQAQLLGAREFGLLTIANVLSLPPHKLGHPARTSYSSLESENQSFLDDSLERWLVEWESECEDKLLSEPEKEADSHFIEFNRAALLRADLNSRYRAYATGRQWGWLSRNDIRAKENEPPIEGGDDYLTPSNMTPVGQQPPADQPQPAETVTESTRNAILDRLERLQKVEADQARKAADRGGDFCRWVDTFTEQQQQRMEESLAPLLRIWFAMRGGHQSNADLAAAAHAADWAARTRQELLDAAGRSTPANLRVNVDAAVSSWDALRLQTTLDSIMEDSQ
jgi:HK97 family phage portal protein